MEYKNLIGGAINDKISIYNCDCMELLKQTPDNYYSLALIDPPYGIGEDGSKNHSRGKLAKPKNYKAFAGNDLKAPDKEFFNELFRISKNQIIFGANHFISKIPFDSSCWIVWDKDNGENDFADCELAWTSFDSAVRKFKWRWQGMLQENMKNKEDRIHPTQKPVALYAWILKNYAKQGDKIIDTHFGSGSIACAVHEANSIDKMDLSLVACELDKDYFESSIQRVKAALQTQSLF